MIFPILVDILIWCWLGMSGRKKIAEAKSIHCIDDEPCSVLCNDMFTCKQLFVDGPIDAELTVICNGKSLCTNAVFYATESSKLNITGCGSDESCLNMTIYCPPNTNQAKHCFVEGGESIANGLTIYAINGWDDIEVSYSGDSIQDGIMYCGEEYEQMCKVAPTDWLCVDDNQCILLSNNLNADTNGDANATRFIPIREENFYDTVRDPIGILYVGLFLVIISLSWIVCAIIKYSLKSRAQQEMMGHDPRVDDNSSSDDSDDNDLQPRYGVTLPHPATPDRVTNDDNAERIPSIICE